MLLLELLYNFRHFDERCVKLPRCPRNLYNLCTFEHFTKSDKIVRIHVENLTIVLVIQFSPMVVGYQQSGQAIPWPPWLHSPQAWEKLWVGKGRALEVLLPLRLLPDGPICWHGPRVRWALCSPERVSTCYRIRSFLCTCGSRRLGTVGR